jgi:photosystem II stability/assembly factor-like uncharacterized protein
VYALLRTDDGGATWQHVIDGPSSVCFASQDIGFAAESHALLRSTDGGRTWTAVFNPPVLPGDWKTMVQCPTPTDVWYFVRAGETLMEQEGYALFRSSDGGAHFTLLAVGPYVPVANIRTNRTLASALGPFRAFSGSSALFLGFCPACGPMRPTVTVTQDGGRTFHPRQVPIQAFD